MKIGPNNPAFPTADSGAYLSQTGIPIRLHIATMLMQGLNANPQSWEYGHRDLAAIALDQADALIQRYNETTP